jgi:hypothetical protein
LAPGLLVVGDPGLDDAKASLGARDKTEEARELDSLPGRSILKAVFAPELEDSISMTLSASSMS